MKATKEKIIVILVFFGMNLFAQISNIDLNKYDFFGFRMNQSVEEVKNYLRSKKKNFIVNNKTDFLDNSIEYLVISPKGQHIEEGTNLDYNIIFYKNQILSIVKFNPSNYYQFKKKVLNDIGNYTIVRSDNPDIIICHTNSFLLYFQEFQNEQRSLVIQNKNLLLKIWEKRLSNSDKEIITFDRESNLYSSNNLSSEIIRKLNKGEKVEVFKKGNEEIINDRKAIWYQVITMYQEYKWILKYINEEQKSHLTPTIPNLRFRESPTLDGKFIRMLKQNEKLELIEKGKTETIGDAKGTWVKVRTEKGEIGWCFDAYLKEIGE